MTEHQAQYNMDAVGAIWPPAESAYAEALRLADTLEGTKWHLADALWRAVNEEGRTIREFTAEAHDGDLTKEDSYGNYLRAETFRRRIDRYMLYEDLIENLDISYWWMAEKGVIAGMDADDIYNMMVDLLRIGKKRSFRKFAAQIATATGRAKDFHAYLRDFKNWYTRAREIVIGGRDVRNVSEQDATDFFYHVEEAQKIAERMLDV